MATQLCTARREICAQSFLKHFNSQKHNIRHHTPMDKHPGKNNRNFFSILQGFLVSQANFALLFTRITMGEFENENLHQQIDSKVQYLDQEKTSKELGELNSVQEMLLPLIKCFLVQLKKKKTKLISIRKYCVWQYSN